MTHTPHRILPRIAYLPTRSSGLPDGSRIRKGKQWPQSQNAARVKEFHIYRYDPDNGDLTHQK